ncbi:MAG: hypothetical protein JXB23_01525 [Candidatus Aminicenantes bacterium]|nr:hypothetical protein [Candidatus Aminicenantes bacterium]
MSDKTVESLLKRVVSVLSEFFPQQKYLYFPLVSAALIWAVRRPEEWREKIFSWRVWPDPEYLAEKPDAFIESFLRNDADLAAAFKDEIKHKNFKYLRDAFLRLYPLFGLDDPFLTALFREEIASKSFRKIVLEFDARVEQAKADIEACKGRPRLLEALKTVSGELSALGAVLLSQADVQKSLEKLVKSRIDDEN